MEGLRVVEYRPELAADALTVRNAIFPPLTVEQWLETTTMTGPIAYLGDEPVGCIPMDQRDFLIAPDTPIRGAFENAVGTREDMRSKGIGTAMIEAATEFLSDRIDALMVYRGAERTAGYRFYEKSGHRDLIYARSTRWEDPSGSAGGVGLGGPDEIAADAHGIHDAFCATYKGAAGFPPRAPGYQAAQLNHQIYTVSPQGKLYFRYPDHGEPEAYCIVGMRETEQSGAVMNVLEMASRTGERAMKEVLSAVGADAAKRGACVTRYTSHDDPFRMVAREVGFVEELRRFMIMGQVVRPQVLFEKACTEMGLVEDLKVDVWTPTRDYTLYEGPRAKTELTIEGKDVHIIRMLCRRLGVRCAMERDLISVRNCTPEIAERLESALPFAPWAYHHIDYV